MHLPKHQWLEHVPSKGVCSERNRERENDSGGGELRVEEDERHRNQDSYQRADGGDEIEPESEHSEDQPQVDSQRTQRESSHASNQQRDEHLASDVEIDLPVGVRVGVRRNGGTRRFTADRSFISVGERRVWVTSRTRCEEEIDRE